MADIPTLIERVRGLTRAEMFALAMNCDVWPEWLADAVEAASEAAHEHDMSAEQAKAEAEGLEASLYGRLSELHSVVCNGRALVTLWREPPDSSFAALVLKSAADARITALQAEVERLTKERDEAEDEEHIKAWANTDAVGAAMTRADAAESQLATARKEVERLREALEQIEGLSLGPDRGSSAWVAQTSANIARAALTEKAEDAGNG